MSQTPSNVESTCRRCGSCCEQGGPALHFDDLDIVNSRDIGLRDLVVVRTGEPAYDQRQGRVLPAEREFLKLAGRQGSWSCKFFEKTRGCGIYGRRPLECRLLFCRETGPLEAVIGRDLISRRDLLAVDDQVLPCVERMEREVHYQEVRTVLADLAQHSSVGENLACLEGLVRADLAIRESFVRSFPGRIDEELFLFGRPLFLVIAPYGYRLVEDVAGIGLQLTD